MCKLVANGFKSIEERPSFGVSIWKGLTKRVPKDIAVERLFENDRYRISKIGGVNQSRKSARIAGVTIVDPLPHLLLRDFWTRASCTIYQVVRPESRGEF